MKWKDTSKAIAVVLFVGTAFFAVVLGLNYLRVSNAMLEETKRNNIFQRHLSYENGLIQQDIMCRELGKLSGAHNDYYFDINLKRCVPDISTGNLYEDSKLTVGKYRGMMTDDHIRNYYRFFSEFREPEPWNPNTTGEQ